jgi:hypothetical protein
MSSALLEKAKPVGTNTYAWRMANRLLILFGLLFVAVGTSMLVFLLFEAIIPAFQSGMIGPGLTATAYALGTEALLSALGLFVIALGLNTTTTEIGFAKREARITKQNYRRQKGTATFP